MESIIHKVRLLFSTMADKNRTFFSTLHKSTQNSLSKVSNIELNKFFKSSSKNSRLQYRKEYFSKNSKRSVRNNKNKRNEVLNEKINLNLDIINKSNIVSKLGMINKSSLKLWGKSKHVAVALVAVLCIAGISGLAIANATEKAVEVQIDGKKIAFVASKTEGQKVLEQLKKEKTEEWNRKITYTEKVGFVETEAKRYQIEDSEDLKEVLENNLTFVGVASAVEANGKVLAVVEDATTAEKLMDNLKERFTSKLDNVEIESVKFKEQVKIKEVPATLKEIVDVDKAIGKIINGQEKAKVHVVNEGESLWSIARKYDTHVEDLQEANPQLKGEKLDIGQELKLVKVEPLLTVEVIAEATVEEKIPYNVKVVQDKSMWKGQQKVKQKGEDGKREVTYKLVFANGVESERTVLDENILKPAKDQVVMRGARLVVASRGGNGKLAWPISGRITSQYGSRWGRMHTGLDIDGYTGQPIGAAEAGTVISAGWDGAYGKQVTIDHGNGLKTKYAHMSSINVSVGAKVSRGELIGRVGSTGRSTGSHLHFEVKVGGGFRNPMSYL